MLFRTSTRADKVPHRQRNRHHLYLDPLFLPPIRRQLRPADHARHQWRQLLRPVHHRRRQLHHRHELHRPRHNRRHHRRSLGHDHRSRQCHRDRHRPQLRHWYRTAAEHDLQQPDAKYRYRCDDDDEWCNGRCGCWITDGYGRCVKCECEREPDGWCEPDGGEFVGVGVLRGGGDVGAELRGWFPSCFVEMYKCSPGEVRSASVQWMQILVIAVTMIGEQFSCDGRRCDEAEGARIYEATSL